MTKWKPARLGLHAPRTRTGVSWQVVIAAAVVVVAVGWVAIDWLLEQAAAAKDPGSARVDAIKTGLGVGAGTTGIFALLLAIRRQNHHERTAADATHDATERRVTELYTKAVEQLGSAKAPVRLGGLYALERLGETQKSQRSTIVNVICAYLRMRYALPAEPAAGAPAEHHDRYEDRMQEAQVRFTAQRILRRHRQPLTRPNLFWAGVTIDLSEADLRTMDFASVDFELANLSGAKLAGANLIEADLRGANCAGTDLSEADLTDARVSSATHLDVPSAYEERDGRLVPK
ncbi:pentapeptide repeat-containing protein [Amycolatopsis sp. NPDC004169]|uniref:pentapeptide repeat-containing protein n=1 Tax=Amycolatopsis sp. NPDC004169 TaxID=3154453 RepID=UPI0033BBEE2C